MIYKEFRLYDGTVIGGTNDLELVEAMAEKKFTKPRSRKSYRRATAKRAHDMHGVEVNFETDETFIGDLVKAQLLMPLEDDH